MSESVNHLRFFNAREEIARHTTVLPHWEQPGATYFVTFRLGDSLPQAKLDSWNRERDHWLASHPKPWSEKDENEYHQRFSATIEQWLDRSHGSCVLRDPDIAGIVGSALQHFEGRRSVQHALVVMPNHVHALFTVLGDNPVGDLLHSWKSYSSHAIHRHQGTSGSLWQRDYFDRMIRDSVHFWNCVRYIRRNPLKACLKPGQYCAFEAEWVSRSLDAGPE